MSRPSMTPHRDMTTVARMLQRSTDAAHTNRAIHDTHRRHSAAYAAADPGLLQGDTATVPAYPFPMNLSLGDKLLSAAQAPPQPQNSGDTTYRFQPAVEVMPHTAPHVELGPDDVVRLQLEVNEYIDGLDARLRELFLHPNTSLAKRMRETSAVPLSFQFFRLQQRMLRLTGDLSADKEREMLSKLAASLSVEDR